MKSAHGYDSVGNRVRVKEYAQNLQTVSRVQFTDAVDLDGEVFDLDEMSNAGLYDEKTDCVTLPKGTRLVYSGLSKVGGYDYASYILPEYNNVEIAINFDYWRFEFSKKVKSSK